MEISDARKIQTQRESIYKKQRRKNNKQVAMETLLLQTNLNRGPHKSHKHRQKEA